MTRVLGPRSVVPGRLDGKDHGAETREARQRVDGAGSRGRDAEGPAEDLVGDDVPRPVVGRGSGEALSREQATVAGREAGLGRVVRAADLAQTTLRILADLRSRIARIVDLAGAGRPRARRVAAAAPDRQIVEGDVAWPQGGRVALAARLRVRPGGQLEIDGEVGGGPVGGAGPGEGVVLVQPGALDDGEIGIHRAGAARVRSAVAGPAGATGADLVGPGDEDARRERDHTGNVTRHAVGGTAGYIVAVFVHDAHRHPVGEERKGCAEGRSVERPGPGGTGGVADRVAGAVAVREAEVHGRVRRHREPVRLTGPSGVEVGPRILHHERQAGWTARRVDRAVRSRRLTLEDQAVLVGVLLAGRLGGDRERLARDHRLALLLLELDGVGARAGGAGGCGGTRRGEGERQGGALRLLRLVLRHGSGRAARDRLEGARSELEHAHAVHLAVGVAARPILAGDDGLRALRRAGADAAERQVAVRGGVSAARNLGHRDRGEQHERRGAKGCDQRVPHGCRPRFLDWRHGSSCASYLRLVWPGPGSDAAESMMPLLLMVMPNAPATTTVWLAPPLMSPPGLPCEMILRTRGCPNAPGSALPSI